MRKLILAIEGGGTKTRILLAGPDGAVHARETGGAASTLYIHRRQYGREVRRLLKRVRAVVDALEGRVAVVGLAAPMSRDLVEEAVRETFGAVQFVCCGESDVALALFGLEWGVSIVAGTGASCRAHTRKGTSVSKGGFGPQFGDEGSGYWIGREAIAAAMRAFDGRGPATLLSGAICEAYGVSHVLDVLQFVDRSGHVPGPRVASLTPRVFDAARAGDVAALGICRRAGAELGKLVVATTRAAAFEEEPIPLVPTGGVFHGDGLVLTPFRRVLRSSGFDFQVYPATPEPAEGILRVVGKRYKGRL